MFTVAATIFLTALNMVSIALLITVAVDLLKDR